MTSSTLLSLAALCALVPATIGAWRGIKGQSPIFWLLVAVAAAGPLVLIVKQFGGMWSTGLSETLWVTIFASVVLFAFVSRRWREGWRLAPLLFPYLLLLGIFAAIWGQAPREQATTALRDPWILFHVVIAVVTYGLLTLAAIAGLAVLIRERSMRSRRRSTLSDLLPSVADAERLEVGLLTASEIVLGLGVLTGMGLQLATTGNLLALDHKTLLTLGGFAVIAVLLFAHYGTGLRGRRAARILLIGYLLVTLGFPGVKFVQDVLLT
ncbi:MAG: cytochrome c biogenesis protein CcsA [Rhodospirillales bacterium]|nr:MAG: cytochrome c biogenesis protein CcsA [Rhodospirillales bacterium]